MRAIYLCLTVFLIGFPQTGAAAIIETGQDLEKACQTPDQLSECLTFLQAVHKTAKEIVRTHEFEPGQIVGACGPEKGIDTLPLAVWLRDAWFAYVDRHPDRLHQRAAAAALHAIEEKWPCGTGGPQ